MSAELVEAFLARLYTDEEARGRFRADPEGEARRAGMEEKEARGLIEGMDWEGLDLAAESFRRKRTGGGR